jgi:histidyl-tRNA synthetase
MAYADKLAIAFTAILGEDEIAANRVSLKDMASGQQQLLTREEAADRILSAVAEKYGEKPIREIR